MLWPALRALSHGDLTAGQLAWLRESFGLVHGPRTVGPGAARSVAHRTATDDAGTTLVVDLARTGDSGWVFTLFSTSPQVPAAAVEAQRTAFRDAIAAVGLELVEISPAATADEVLVEAADPPGTPESAIGAHWDLPDELSRVWPHLGVLADAPREVKKVKLRELMRTPAWRSAPASLQDRAREYLDAD